MMITVDEGKADCSETAYFRKWGRRASTSEVELEVAIRKQQIDLLHPKSRTTLENRRKVDGRQMASL